MKFVERMGIQNAQLVLEMVGKEQSTVKIVPLLILWLKKFL